ncbi:hypothetical protein CPB85DRAFT_1436005 [Mucidula mucida]|nr:hypothetical protein CPB85DRAFT_1436005 [Mucidula mucida]
MSLFFLAKVIYGYQARTTIMESLPDKVPPPPIGLASEPDAVPNGSPPASAPKKSKGKTIKSRVQPIKKARPPLEKHYNRWTTTEQYAFLDEYRPKYLEFKAKSQLNLFWPEVEINFFKRCKQTGRGTPYSFSTHTKLAWTNTSPEVRKECSEAVEQERREKEELMVLEQEEDSQKRTPEQYSSALAMLLAHINVFTSKIAERTGQIFLIACVGPDERGAITSQLWQFGPSYAQVNNVGHTFEDTYSGCKLYFLNQFEEYGRGCFTCTMRKSHILEERWRKVAPVAKAPDMILIDESTIPAPVLTGLVETKDGLNVLGPNSTAPDKELTSGKPNNDIWVPDPFVMNVSQLPSGVSLPNMESSMTLAPSFMFPVSLPPSMESSMTLAPSSTPVVSKHDFGALVHFRPVVSEHGRIDNFGALIHFPYWAKSMPQVEWEQMNSFIKKLDATSTSAVQPVPNMSSTTVMAPAAPAPVVAQEVRPSVSGLLSIPLAAPHSGSTHSRFNWFSRPEEPSLFPPTSTPMISKPISPPPSTTTTKFIPLTTSAWNPNPRILKPAIIKDALPPSSLTDLMWFLEEVSWERQHHHLNYPLLG